MADRMSQESSSAVPPRTAPAGNQPRGDLVELYPGRARIDPASITASSSSAAGASLRCDSPSSARSRRVCLSAELLATSTQLCLLPTSCSSTSCPSLARLTARILNDKSGGDATRRVLRGGSDA
eukprot:scaffold15925_cov54-Phaeocystis_antarctica.AAC.2